MARYRLTEGHYLNVLGTEWEQTEVDLTTGKQVRKRYPVPMYLNPNFKEDQNYPGEIIIASKTSSLHPRDIIFSGPPTMSMTPLDEEAEAEIAKLQGQHPIESLPATGQPLSEVLLMKLTQQLDAAAVRGMPTYAGDRVAALEKQLEELKALLVSKPNKAPEEISI